MADSAEHLWELDNGQAVGNVGPWQLAVQPTQPAAGISIKREGFDDCTLLGIQAAETHQLVPEEVYVRGNDLIARFDQSVEDQFAFQLDWRIISPQEDSSEILECFPGVELWLSVQTDDLHSMPQLLISLGKGKSVQWTPWSGGSQADTASTSTQGVELGPAGLLGEQGSEDSQEQMPVTFLLIEPTDRRHVREESASEDGSPRLRVFDHFMEKGVIRRARMRLHWGDVFPTEAELEALYANLIASPLPLTA